MRRRRRRVFCTAEGWRTPLAAAEGCGRLTRRLKDL